MPVNFEPQKHQQCNDRSVVSGAAPTGNIENHQTNTVVQQSCDPPPQTNVDPMQNPASNMPIEYFTGVPVVQQPFEPTKRLQYASETVYYDVDSQMKKLGRPVNAGCNHQQENFLTPAPTPSDCSGFTGPLSFQYNVRLAGDPQMVYQAQPVYQNNSGPVQPQYSQAPKQQYVSNQTQIQTIQPSQQQFLGPTQPQYFPTCQQQCTAGQVNPQMVQAQQHQMVAGQAQPHYYLSTQQQYTAVPSQPQPNVVQSYPQIMQTPQGQFTPDQTLPQSFQSPQQHHNSGPAQIQYSQAPQQQFDTRQFDPQTAQTCQQQQVAAQPQPLNPQASQQQCNTGQLDTRFTQASSQQYAAQNQVQYSNTPQQPCIPAANQPQFVAVQPQQQCVAGPTQSQCQVSTQHSNTTQSNSQVVQPQQHQFVAQTQHYQESQRQYYPQVIHILHPHPASEPYQIQFARPLQHRGQDGQTNSQVPRAHHQQFDATQAPAQYSQATRHQHTVQNQAKHSETPKTWYVFESNIPKCPQPSQLHKNYAPRSQAASQQNNVDTARKNQPQRSQDAQKPSVTSNIQPQNFQPPQQQIFLRHAPQHFIPGPNQPQHPQVLQTHQQQYMAAANQGQYTQTFQQQCVGKAPQIQNSQVPSQQMSTPSSVQQPQPTPSMDPQWNSGPQYDFFNVPIQGTMSFRMLWQPNQLSQSEPQSQPQLQYEMQPQLQQQPQLKPQEESRPQQQHQPQPTKSLICNQPPAQQQSSNSEEQTVNSKLIPQQELENKIPEKTTTNNNLQEKKIEKNDEESTSGHKTNSHSTCNTKAVGVQTINESTSSHDVNVSMVPIPKKNEPSKKQVNTTTDTERAPEETPILSNGAMTFATEQSSKSYSSIVAKSSAPTRKFLNTPTRTSKQSFSTKMLKLGDYLVDSRLNYKQIEQRSASSRTKLTATTKNTVIHELLTTPKMSNNENDAGLEISQQMKDCKNRDSHQTSKSVSDDDSFKVPKKLAKPVIIRKKNQIDWENEENSKICEKKEDLVKDDVAVCQPDTSNVPEPITEQVSSKENINPENKEDEVEDTSKSDKKRQRKSKKKKKVVEEEEFDLNAEKNELESFKDAISRHCSKYHEAMTHARHGFKSFQLRDRILKPDFGEIGEKIFAFFEANSLANMKFCSKKVETKKFASKKASFYGSSGNLTNQKLKIFYERIEKVIEEENESHRFIEDILFLMSDCGRRNLDELYMKTVLEFPEKFANCKRIMPLTLESFENIQTVLEEKYLKYFIGYMNRQFTFRSFSPPVDQMNSLPHHEKLLIEKFKVSWHSAGVDFDELAMKYFETKRSQLMEKRTSPQNECFIKFYSFLLEISSSIFSFDVSFRKCCEHPKADKTVYFLFDDISFFKLYFGYEA